MNVEKFLKLIMDALHRHSQLKRKSRSFEAQSRGGGNALKCRANEGVSW
jgi:hypothetical protein